MIWFWMSGEVYIAFLGALASESPAATRNSEITMRSSSTTLYIQHTISVATKGDVLTSTKQDGLHYGLELSTITGYQLLCRFIKPYLDALLLPRHHLCKLIQLHNRCLVVRFLKVFI